MPKLLDPILLQMKPFICKLLTEEYLLLRYKLNFAEIEQGRPATVKDAAVAFKEICYEYRLFKLFISPEHDFDNCFRFRDSLMAGLIVAGYDAVHKQGQVLIGCEHLAQHLNLQTIDNFKRCGACPLEVCACVSP